MQDFQAFTIKYRGRTNVLFGNVQVSQAFDPQVLAANQPQPINTVAIWDTGATCTVISKQFAAQVGLIPTGKTKITGVNHTTLENTYLANIYLPNKVCMTHVKIAEVPAITGNAGLLIGMDIIGAGDFSVYSEDNKTVMTYRFPSIGGTDFVQLAGNIRSQRATIEKIEVQKASRTHVNKEKSRKKHKQERQNKKKNRKHKKR